MTDVSGQIIRPIFKDQVVQEEFLVIILIILDFEKIALWFRELYRAYIRTYIHTYRQKGFLVKHSFYVLRANFLIRINFLPVPCRLALAVRC